MTENKFSFEQDNASYILHDNFSLEIITKTDRWVNSTTIKASILLNIINRLDLDQLKKCVEEQSSLPF